MSFDVRFADPRGRRIATAAADVAAGQSTVPIPDRIRQGLYTVRVRATGDGQLAAANAEVLVGGRLPRPFARRFLRSRLRLMRIFQDGGAFKLMCRRLSPGRIDCGVIKRRRCAGVLSVRVQRDGSLATTQYSGGNAGRCRVRR